MLAGQTAAYRGERVTVLRILTAPGPYLGHGMYGRSGVRYELQTTDGRILYAVNPQASELVPDPVTMVPAIVPPISHQHGPCRCMCTDCDECMRKPGAHAPYPAHRILYAES